MSKFVIVTFPDEAKAYEGTRALQSLHEQGSLSLYEMAVVARGADGRLLVKQAPQEGAMGITVGSVVGGLVGLMGGPLGGLIGLSGGALLGSVSDLYSLGLSQDFLETISEHLQPGKVALVAEVGEDWVTPLNSAMAPLGGTLLRRWRVDVEEEQTLREHAALRKEHAQLKKEWEQAGSENKARLHLALEHLHAQIESAAHKVQSRLGQLEQATEAKIKSLSEQAAKVQNDAREAVDGRIHTLRQDLARRSGQFQKAWTLTKEALSV